MGRAAVFLSGHWLHHAIPKYILLGYPDPRKRALMSHEAGMNFRGQCFHRVLQQHEHRLAPQLTSSVRRVAIALPIS